jgi:hypothetical protein
LVVTKRKRYYTEVVGTLYLYSSKLTTKEPDPAKRLGANGYGEIKGHLFFAGMDFVNIHHMTPPKILHVRSGTRVGRQKITKERQKLLDEQKNSQWAKFLFENELIVQTGLVWKKKQLRLPRKRQLILTDFPRLICIQRNNHILESYNTSPILPKAY